MPNLKTPAAMAVAVLCLAACGKSADTRKAEAVKCAAFFKGYTEAALSGDALLNSFSKEVSAAATGHPADDDSKVQGVVSLGEQVAPQVEAVRREAVQQDGLQDLVKLIHAKDAKGVVTYLDECVDNRDRMLAAAR